MTRLAPRALFVLLVAALAVLLSGPAPAGAHATLITSSPADGERLERPPAEAILEFSEGVAIGPGGVDVLDASGTPVQASAAIVDDATVRVPLPASLPTGSYVVSYRLTSADGHPISGGVVFGIGVDADADTLAETGASEPSWADASALGRFLTYVAALLAAGTAFALSVVVDPRVATARLHRLTALASGATIVAAAFLVAAHTASSTGEGWGAALEVSRVRAALGAGLGLECALLVVAVAMALASSRIDSAGRALAWASPLVAGAGFAAWGHARVADPVALSLVADVLHVGAAAVWFGGLIVLTRVLVERAVPLDAAAATVVRFSDVAGWTVIVLAIAGTAMTATELARPSEVWSSGWGQVLLAKLAVVAVVLALAAWNRYRLLPALGLTGAEQAEPREQADEEAGWRDLRRSTVAEAALLVAALAITSVLVDVTPPPEATAGPAKPVQEGGPFRGETELETATLVLEVSPGAAGSNTIHLSYLDATGALVDAGEEVTIELTLPSAQLGPIVRTPERLLAGHYAHSGTELSIAGEWEVSVVTRTDRFSQERSTFIVPIG